jgi:hypothetical protein
MITIIKQFYKTGFVLLILFCTTAFAQAYDAPKTTAAGISGNSYFCIGLEFFEDISFGRLTFNTDGSVVFAFDEVRLDGTYVENGNNFTITISSFTTAPTLNGTTKRNDRIIIMTAQGLPYPLIDEHWFIGFKTMSTTAAIE